LLSLDFQIKDGLKDKMNIR